MFSNSTKYAIRTIVELSKAEESEKQTVDYLATELDIPKPFLSKILQQLSKAEIISSLKGRGGGFYLTEKNREHKLIDVIKCIDGRNFFNTCILGLNSCDSKNPCLLHFEYTKIKKHLEKKICDSSLKELIANIQ